MSVRLSTRIPPPDVEASELYVPITTGVYKIKGRIYEFHRGRKRYVADHPLVKSFPDKFRRLTAEDVEVG